MKREQLVGRRITRLMRDEVIIEKGKPPIPGISDGVYRFFHVFVELDGRDAVEVGLDRLFYPLTFVSNDVRGRLTDIGFPDGVGGCIGEIIMDVLTISEQITFRLSSGRYISVEDSLQGTEVCLDDPQDVPEEALRDYWESP